MSIRKLVVLTYYWPPSGGSGVQRWVYFTHHLKKMGWEPIIITVDDKQASYPQRDKSLNTLVQNIRVIRTPTREPLHQYARWLGKGSIPQGAVPRKTIFQKLAAFIRGNFFVPDARIGWVPFARKALKELLATEKIDWVITTGPPHSTHLAVLPLKQKDNFRWLVDLRDPWTDLFYNQQLYRLSKTHKKDQLLEKKVLQSADTVLTTVGGELHTLLKQRVLKQNFVAIPNGFDTEKIQTFQRQNLVGVFHVVFTGLLTQNQDYPALLQALQNLNSPLPIRLSLAGQIDSIILQEIKAALPEIDLHHLDYLPHKKALGLMFQADVLVNFIFKGASTQMISGKLLEYMATGVPVLSLGDPQSEAGRLLQQGAAAEMIGPKDIEKIVGFLEKAVQQKGRWENDFPQKNAWSREGTAQRLGTLLSK